MRDPGNEVGTPQVCKILDVSRLLNVFLGFNWSNSQSLPNFQQHFCKFPFDSGVVICILLWLKCQVDD